MFRYLTRGFWVGCRRPVVLLLAGSLLCLTGFAAPNLWAWHHFRAAESALHHEDIDQARYHISQCLRVWHGAQTHFLAARIERLSEDFPEAEQHLTECIRLQHGPSEATEVESLLLRAQWGSLHEVEAVLWKCLEEKHPESPWIAQCLAQIYLGDSRLRSAIRCLDRWLECDPQAARAWHWRGWAHERLSEPEKAIADYERAVEIDPTRWGARLRLAGVYLDQYDADKARPHVEELQRTHGDDPMVQTLRAQCWTLEGEQEKAIALLDQVLHRQPAHCEALKLRAQLSADVEPPAEAVAWLRKALEQRPEDVPTLYTLAKCLKKQGKKEEMAQILSRHQRAKKDAMRLGDLLDHEVERTPQNPDVLSEVGAILLRRGETEAGLQWLYRALAQNPNHAPTHEILIHHFEACNDFQQAEKHRRYLHPQELPSSPTVRP